MTSPASEALPSYRTGPEAANAGLGRVKPPKMARGGSQENSFTAALA